MVGYVRAVDQDVNAVWGAVNFDLLPSPDTAFFTINATSGAISVAMAALDFWDQPSFTFNVTVSDSDFYSPIVVTRAVTVNLIQANRVRVAGFFVAAGTPADRAVNVSGSAYALVPSLATMDVLLTAEGYSALYVSGAGLGPTARRLVGTGAAITATIVTATFASGTYAATCQVVLANTVLRCVVPAGVGKDHTWTVTVGGVWSATSSAKTGYFPPTITAVLKSGANPVDNTTQVVTTRGTDMVVVRGFNFGPSAANTVQLSYGRTSLAAFEYLAIPCTWTVAQYEVQCPTRQGVGAGLKWVLTIGSQLSAVFADSAVQYRPPTITSIVAPVMATEGGEMDALIVNGTELGPVWTASSDLETTYAVDHNSTYYTVFRASACRVSAANPHGTLICTTAPVSYTHLTLPTNREV